MSGKYPNDPYAGKMYRAYVVVCGKCRINDTFPGNSQKSVGETLMYEGWDRVGYYGWICPDCALDCSRAFCDGRVDKDTHICQKCGTNQMILTR